MVKWLLSIITILFFNLQSQAQFTSVSFSVQAHQDDWQLFMSSRVIADMSVSGRKMVFITLTAGDESCGPCSYGAIPFYLGREKGSVNGAKFAADLTLGTIPLDIPTATTVGILGSTVTHNITKYVYKNTVNYFLRLPDGDVSGAGFNNNNFQSLQRLKTGAISTISTIGVPSDPVAPTATYSSWADLVATIRTIINTEKIAGTQTWINTAHTIDGSNSTYNPNDHSDHRYSSLAAQEAVASGMAWVGVNGFMDYNSSAFGSNLGETDHENASILFALEVFGMTADGNYQNDFASNHQQWLPIDLNQIIRNPTGVAPFAGPTPEGFIPPSVSLTEIPIVVSVTSPAYINKDIKLFISPYEPGQLSTTVYDMSGNKVFELKTTVENRDGFFVTLKDAVKVQGTYIIKSILNDKFIETRKIVVQ